MRWAHFVFCCLVLAFVAAGGDRAPTLAADLSAPPRAAPGNHPYAEDGLSERDVADFCHGQRGVCRRICDLRSRFEDRFDACPHSCDSREGRCTRTGCYKWSEPEFVLAQKFGGHKCAL